MTRERRSSIIIITASNDVKRISMDRISFLVTLIYSYSDQKLKVSSCGAKVVGSYARIVTQPAALFRFPTLVQKFPRSKVLGVQGLSGPQFL